MKEGRLGKNNAVRNIFSVVLIIILIAICLPKHSVSAFKSNPVPQSAPDQDYNIEAILINDINNRPIRVTPGNQVTYRLNDTDTFVIVTSYVVPFYSASLLISQYNTKIIPAADYWTTWQVCGIQLSRPILGVVGELYNRAYIAYWNPWRAVAPATFYQMDMSGTYAGPFHQWENLSQYSYPSLGTYFSYSGYVQASGVLKQL